MMAQRELQKGQVSSQAVARSPLLTGLSLIEVGCAVGADLYRSANLERGGGVEVVRRLYSCSYAGSSPGACG